MNDPQVASTKKAKGKGKGKSKVRIAELKSFAKVEAARYDVMAAAMESEETDDDLREAILKHIGVKV